MVKKYLLDTSVLIDLGRNKESVLKILQKVNIEECEICSIVTAEYFQGLFMAKNIKLEQNWYERFVESGNMNVLSFDEKCAKRYGEIQAKNFMKGTSRPLFDLIIATICIENNLTLITENIKDFEMIEGLKIYRKE